jgi:Flp pilus assembly protein TadB
METRLGSLSKPKRKLQNPFSKITDILYRVMETFLKLFAYALVTIGNGIATVFQMVFITVRGTIAPFAEVLVKFTRSTHHRAGSLFPFHIRENLEEMFLYSGITRNPEETLGMTLVYSVLVPIITGLIAFIFTSNPLMALGIAILSFVLVWLLLWMFLNLLVDKRSTSIERVLPDLLSMIAQNMSAGMTPYNALWVASRPEFGALADEIQKVARDTLTGTPLETALLNMSKRVKSNKLRRTVKLMIQGMRSGGELPTVLQEIARDIRTEQNLVRRMESETTSQVMFILFSLVFGAPLLFAASSQFVSIFSKVFSMIDVDKLEKAAQGSGMVTLQPLVITEEGFVMYAVIVLAVCSFFGSLIIGLMRSGKMSRGITMIPVIMALSVGLFLLMRFALSSFFGGMMTVGA